MRKAIARDDPAAVLEGPKRGRSLPKILSIAEVDRLLNQAHADAADPERHAPERLRAARLACLLEVLYATGLRVSELVALPASAARQDARMLVVRGKGDKERLVPLNDAAKRAMARLSGSAAKPAAAAGDANGCFRHSARAAISRASILRATSRPSPPRPG